MNRRDLLKHFGIGAVIAPVVGGVLQPVAAATLIEVPKVKPVELFSRIPESIDFGAVRKATLNLQMRDGSVRSIAMDYVWSRAASDEKAPVVEPGDLRVFAKISRVDFRHSPPSCDTLVESGGIAEIL